MILVSIGNPFCDSLLSRFWTSNENDLYIKKVVNKDKKVTIKIQREDEESQ